MGDDIDAIESYTKSLAYADNKELMAYAHANRSAALFRKEMYKECLMDIDAALLCGYPENKRAKLMERGTKAIDELKKSLQISEDKYTNIEKIIDQICLNQNTKEDITKTDTNDIHVNDKNKERNLLLDNHEKRFLNISHLPIKCTTQKPRYLEKEGSLFLAYGQNKECPAASDGIKIVFSKEFGRHLIATKDLSPGDIITIENPYAHVIYEDRYNDILIIKLIFTFLNFCRFYTHCHQCLSRCYNLIPCSNCPIAQYCSEECKKIAWEMAHVTECPILVLLKNLLNVDKDKIRMLTKIIRLLIVVTKNGSKIKELQEDMKIAESNPGIFIFLIFVTLHN